MSTTVDVSIPCNLCGGTDVEVVGTLGRDGDRLRTVLCRACGLGWTDPRPTAEENKEYYSKKYRLEYKGTYHPKFKHVYRDGRRAVARWERVKDLVRDGVRVLDVGAGAGLFLYILKSVGCEVHGIEPNEGYADYASGQLGVPTQNGFVQDFEFPDDHFDLITINHVVEHLEDPGAVLALLRRWLKPDGKLVVEVPNIEATHHAPKHRFHLAHIYSFNPPTLEALGRKQGLAVADTQLIPGTLHVNTIFAKGGAPASAADDPELKGNFAHVERALKSHTTASHYLSPKPYARLIKKLSGYAREQRKVREFEHGRDILDYLIDHLVK